MATSEFEISPDIPKRAGAGRTVILTCEVPILSCDITYTQRMAISGIVQGLLVDERTWAIRYIIVNTSNWWLGHTVLIAPEWIDEVYWAESKLVVALTRDSIRSAPKYDSNVPITREQEKILHTFYE